MIEPREYIETLAAALDSDDYETAKSAFAESVSYVIGEETLLGPDRIVASYREASEMAHRIFDDVGYDHQVHGTDDPEQFIVAYQDILTIGNETLTHQARQHVRAQTDKGVVHIVNVEVPGESERVDEFLARHGRSRDWSPE